MTLLLAALRWLEQGVSLLPVQPRSKHLVATFGAYGQRIVSAEDARVWFGERKCNLALVCGSGPGGGLLALDFDDRADYDAWCRANQELARSRTDLTRRGAHVYLWAPAFGAVDRAAVPGAEVIHRGHIVAAPSIHPSGFEYRVADPDALVLPAPASWCSDSKTKPGLPLLSKSPASPVSALKDSVDVVTALKLAFPVLDLAQTLTKLSTRDERWWHGSCPFHQDLKPSFWVDAERGQWGCYSCRSSGDVINLFAMAHGLSVNAAIADMARRKRDGAPWP